jgi:hypothetical protein
MLGKRLPKTINDKRVGLISLNPMSPPIYLKHILRFFLD